MTDKPLASRVALITGASRGIGYATALALARAGAHVVATARTVGGLEELDDAIRAAGGSATLVPLDMTDFDGIDRLAAAIRERYGKLDCLIGNAGTVGSALSPLDHVPLSDWDNIMAVNVTANWRLIRAFNDLLKASDAGRVVLVSSGISYLLHAYWGPYAVSKAALNALASVYAKETATTNIKVNLFGPGQVNTRLLGTAMPSLDMSVLNTPETIAPAIVALCLPSMMESGKYYSFQAGKFLELKPPE